MVKVQKAFSVERAIHSVLAEFDEHEIKQITGKSISLVRKWADEDCDYNHFPWEQAVNLAAALLAQGKQERFTEAFRNALSRKVEQCGGAPTHTPVHPSERLIDLMKEVGDVAACVRAATAPKSPAGQNMSLAERNEVTKELLEVRDVIDAALRDMEF
ncbi:MAG: hypothetical protein ACNI26_13170 [Terasakiella sp.]|uniref:hypothetical protein n=1 Tax=unclassified Terasakiella TaxID=2614952 RepID=UPI003AFFF792